VLLDLAARRGQLRSGLASSAACEENGGAVWSSRGGGGHRGSFIGEGYFMLRKDYSTDSLSNLLLESTIPLGFDKWDNFGLVLIQDKSSAFDSLLRFRMQKSPRWLSGYHVRLASVP
jgi:hypothetical protein